MHLLNEPKIIEILSADYAGNVSQLQAVHKKGFWCDYGQPVRG